MYFGNRCERVGEPRLISVSVGGCASHLEAWGDVATPSEGDTEPTYPGNCLVLEGGCVGVARLMDRDGRSWKRAIICVVFLTLSPCTECSGLTDNVIASSYQSLNTMTICKHVVVSRGSSLLLTENGSLRRGGGRQQQAPSDDLLTRAVAPALQST